MNKHFLLFLSLMTLLVVSIYGQAPLYELSLAHKSQHASTIIEARVIGQKAFWNPSHTLIHTAYTLEVYKIFKGDIQANKVEIIVEGGRIGYEMHVADPGLKLQIGDVGTFFCQAPRVLHRSTSEIEQLMPYGGVQGFIQYDELQGRASDVFQVYDDIERQVYAALASEVQRSYRELHPYSILAQRQQSQNRATPILSSFTPTSVTAGTDSMITITGSNFGTYDGGTNSLVFFPDANDGGASLIGCTAYHIISWTDIQIEVRVPSRASTGLIAVRNATNETGFAGSNLNVTYNLSNVLFSGSYFRPKLQDDNGTGGYDLIYSTSTANNGVDFSTSAAVAPFNRALSTWNCETLLNVETTGATTASNTVDANTAPNIVMFDDDATPLASGTLGVCYSGYGSCDGTTWYINGFDIVFKRSGTDGVTWNYGPTATSGGNYDFETVALHELGHGHGIGHINAGGSVMHYALSNNYDARTLDVTRDVGAGVEVIDESKSMATCGGAVTGTTDFPCVLPTSVEMEVRHEGNRNLLTWQLTNPSVWQSQILEKYDAEMDSYLAFAYPQNNDECDLDCEYEVPDYRLRGDRSLYRLALTDLNGGIQYSAAVEVTHPNISRAISWTYERSAEQLICFLSFEESPQIQIHLLDLQGRVLGIDFESNGLGQWSANTHQLSNGVYLLRVVDPLSKVQKLSKVHILH